MSLEPLAPLASIGLLRITRIIRARYPEKMICERDGDGGPRGTLGVLPRAFEETSMSVKGEKKTSEGPSWTSLVDVVEVEVYPDQASLSGCSPVGVAVSIDFNDGTVMELIDGGWVGG